MFELSNSFFFHSFNRFCFMQVLGHRDAVIDRVCAKEVDSPVGARAYTYKN